MNSLTPHRPGRRASRILAAAAGFATVGALVAALPANATQDRPHGGKGGRTVDVQLLSFNDFHGNLEPPAYFVGPGHGEPAGRHHEEGRRGRRRVPRHVPADRQEESPVQRHRRGRMT